MVSKAREDLPEPLKPVITVSVLRGISTSMFFRLCWRAPRTVILVMAMRFDRYAQAEVPPNPFPERPHPGTSRNDRGRGGIPFRTVDRCTERTESGEAHFYSRI